LRRVSVIASEAKQSRAANAGLDYFVAALIAMTLHVWQRDPQILSSDSNSQAPAFPRRRAS